MRKVFMFVFLFFIAGNSFSQYSNLTVFSEKGLKFRLVVNGIDQNTELASVVFAKNIYGDNCYVQIYFEDSLLGRVNKDLRLLPAGNEFSLCVKKKKKGFVIKKVKSVPIIVGKPSYEIFSVNNGGSTNFDKNILPGYKGRVVGSNPMSSKDFIKAKAKVPKEMDSKKQLANAKSVFENETLLTRHIISVLGDFTYPYTRLQFAKFAYMRVYDINNFGKVFDLLENGNYKDELLNFVLQNPR
ncbi:MAG: DUF4476 domain-containing protein [Bacteroidales bacterium]|nr:DUF4476 domain-containing protein [Bacteroidales bacterium]